MKNAKYSIEDEYTDKDGRPIKCKQCQHTVIVQIDNIRPQAGIEEFKFKCDKCGSIEGHWLAKDFGM